MSDSPALAVPDDSKPVDRLADVSVPGGVVEGVKPLKQLEGRAITFKAPAMYTGESLPPSKRAAIKGMWAMNYSIADMVKAEKVSKNTIKAFILNEAHKDSELTDSIRKHLAGQWFMVGTRALHAITPEKLKSSSAPQLAIVASIATEKARLCEGLSTGRIEIDLTDPDLDAQIAQKESELSAWRSGQLVNAQASESQP